jgi:hypothetical protein
MKKRAALVAAIVSVLSVFPIGGASASCHEIDGVNGCVEGYICRAVAVVNDTANCVM